MSFYFTHGLFEVTSLAITRTIIMASIVVIFKSTKSLKDLWNESIDKFCLHIQSMHIIKAIDLLKLLVICLISKRKMVRHQYQKKIISACLFVTEVLLIKANFNSCIPNSIEFRYNNTDPCVIVPKFYRIWNAWVKICLY